VTQLRFGAMLSLWAWYVTVAFFSPTGVAFFCWITGISALIAACLLSVQRLGDK